MRAGIFQSSCERPTPIDRLAGLAAAVQSEHFDLLVCPELFMSGYDVGDKLFTRAESSDGPFAHLVAELSLASGTTIVYGYPERAGAKLYNAAACISPAGRLLANHRKLVLPPGFESRYFEPGSELTVFEIGGVRCAILICYDAEHPESVRAAAEAGVQVVIVPTALVDAFPNVALQMMPTRAFENGVWVLYANHAGHEAGAHYLGASCIVAPNGNDVARASAVEQVISARLDMACVTAAQARLPYLRDVNRLRTILEARDR